MIYVIIALVWWFFLSSFVISAGYHRYFAHRSFEAPVWYEHVVLALGPLSGSGPVLGWAGVHRLHHIHSDTPLDPHSPKYKSAFEVLTSTFDVPPITHRNVADLLKNKRVMTYYSYHTLIRVATIVVGLAVLPFGLWLSLIISPMFFGYLGYGFLNYWCHRKKDVSNSFLANILTGGEGWHANHHDSPRDWQIGKKWWQFDPAAFFIRMIKT